ncbi:type II toxin-antitoxin system mRNA interferase RelE [Microbacterium aoyamense]|uniref:Type II toxin-antitoxin system mRNA interferase RelE n=1 Tax=Microbacterium aoyamense TaxID=344166 RepID=A0ABP5AKH8_9MICO|nr:type II toxin-antitoxin system RelE/ParE family toxin [Microbacterium aoyamense]
MNWNVQFASAAIRGLDSLPIKIAQAVVEFLTHTLPGNPHRMSKPLQGEFEGLRSARRGDYRVLFLLDDESGTLLVVRIAHRRDAYRPPAPRNQGMG